ncbi:tRNA lysidine(34) synthetase TilS [Lysinibacter sp. HNR]|uniref:tRNA lysidine(34) synthetase TilS n=1 Tax=Lysinibacter sp. HNR TaxID=3031408 RepID=UPI0024359469|nr:tRNA lysidine(34) synthetase TilS [Lysinibacter sp. HNR]WGD36817.1 tRNA lysidine(34) synthetase TilS [Lysinibacter sp. HNR]
MSLSRQPVPPPRPARLTPTVAAVRHAVRGELLHLGTSRAEDSHDSADALVALSGGPDSLALAAATGFEAHRLGLRVGAVIVDHGLQEGSERQAERAAQQAASLGLSPVLIERVRVGSKGGPESAAREARYQALQRAATRTGARAVLLGHTLDDQAETVLLGLARGSGSGSLSGMSVQTDIFIRPLLGIRRARTVEFCEDSSLDFWSDPHNDDPAYTRVRVRKTVLPLLEQELGPGIAEALARTADQMREDAAAFQEMIDEFIEEIVEPAEAGIAVSIVALEANPAALRQRIIRYVVHSEFGVALSRQHTLAAAALVTDWHGQKALNLPGVRVARESGLLVFSSH